MEKTQYIKTVFDKVVPNADIIQNNLSLRESWFLHNYISKLNFFDSVCDDTNLLEEMYLVAKKIDSLSD